MTRGSGRLGQHTGAALLGPHCRPGLVGRPFQVLGLTFCDKSEQPDGASSMVWVEESPYMQIQAPLLSLNLLNPSAFLQLLTQMSCLPPRVAVRSGPSTLWWSLTLKGLSCTPLLLTGLKNYASCPFAVGVRPIP